MSCSTLGTDTTRTAVGGVRRSTTVNCANCGRSVRCANQLPAHRLLCKECFGVDYYAPRPGLRIEESLTEQGQDSGLVAQRVTLAV